MTDDEVEKLYVEAEEATREVAATGAAYAKATKKRGRLFLALRRSGQSLYAMAKRLNLSSARVSQILVSAEKAENATEES